MENIDILKPIINSYPYGDFRKYKPFSKDKQDEYLISQILSINSDSNSRIFVVTDDGVVSGFAVLKYLYWDSAYFGKNMWQIAHLIDRHNDPNFFKTKNRLLIFVMEYCKNKENIHISCKIDTSDISAIRALEGSGFRLMDTAITWLYRPSLKIPRYKTLYKVRLFQKEDLEELLQLTRLGLPKNRFHLDLSILADKADGLYQEWVKKYCVDFIEGKTNVKVFVAEFKSRVIGFSCYGLNEELRRITSYKIIGRGLLAVNHSSRGAGIDLISATFKDTNSNYDFAEFDVSITNNVIMNIYAKLNLKIVRSKYIYHYFV